MTNDFNQTVFHKVREEIEYNISFQSPSKSQPPTFILEIGINENCVAEFIVQA